MNRVRIVKPIMSIGRTNAQSENQGYTYNESGITYNEAGVMYGGKYGNDIYPIISKSTLQRPTLKVGRTNRQFNDQGYTYNEAGFTYNQLGVIYGGLSEHDIYPMISRAKVVKPTNVITGITGLDIYTVTFAILTETGDYLMTEDNNIFQQEH